ncbi:hypothetical protein OF83DRAFT_1118064, partial [Amylostereum chailletii]
MSATGHIVLLPMSVVAPMRHHARALSLVLTAINQCIGVHVDQLEDQVIPCLPHQVPANMISVSYSHTLSLLSSPCPFLSEYLHPGL